MLHLLVVLLLAATGAAKPQIAERTKDLERREGLVPFYWDAGAGQMLLEVRPGAEMFYGVGLAGGAGVLEVSLDRGQLGDLALVRVERVGPRVLLRQLQTTHRGRDDREGQRVVAESFPDSILASWPVVAEGPDRVLVDATEFLLKDTQVLPELRQAQQGDWRQDVARSALHFERTGAFPRNTEIEVVLTFTSDAPPRALSAVLPDGRTLSLRVHHTFLALPEPGYTPLELDPRVGFIPMLVKDYGAPFTEPLERYLVSRWRLAKKDPGARVSDPVQPIVFHLDRGMPEPERQAVKEAALWWNHAFEEAGLRNALVIEDLPEGATFLDARYSGIEWIHRAERGWSVGDYHRDPRTGEILHAVARIDSHRRRTTSRMWQNLQPSARHACAAAAAPAYEALAEPGSADERSLVLRRLAYLSAHEVGHTLGMMHNWAATTFGWGSVMDYLAPNIQPASDGGFDLSDAYPGDVGVYDRLMVRWGYTPSLTAEARDALVREALARGVVYPLEGDPRWAEYDWGPDPVAWLATTQRVRRSLLDRFGPQQVPRGRPLHDLQERFSLAYLYHRFGIQAAQQHVGGQYQTNAVAGDGQAPVAWVPAAKQKEALSLLTAALAPEALDVPDRVLDALVPAPSGTRGTRERFPSEAGATFSLLTAARTLAGLVIEPLLDPARLARLVANPQPDALRPRDLFRALRTATLAAPAPSTPRLRALHTVTSRAYVDAVLDLAARTDTAPEVRAAAFVALEQIAATLDADGPSATGDRALMRRDVTEFLKDPAVRARRSPRPAAPPGRPI